MALRSSAGTLYIPLFFFCSALVKAPHLRATPAKQEPSDEVSAAADARHIHGVKPRATIVGEAHVLKRTWRPHCSQDSKLATPLGIKCWDQMSTYMSLFKFLLYLF